MSAYTHHGDCSTSDPCKRCFEFGQTTERRRILTMKKEIINCVIDYGLTPEKYERICNDIDALIKGENKQEHPQALPLPPKTPENTQPNWTGF